MYYLVLYFVVYCDKHFIIDSCSNEKMGSFNIKFHLINQIVFIYRILFPISFSYLLTFDIALFLYYSNFKSEIQVLYTKACVIRNFCISLSCKIAENQTNNPDVLNKNPSYTDWPNVYADIYILRKV